MLLQIGTRELTLSIAFPVVAIIFVILGLLILKRDPKYLANKSFAIFFWLSALGMFINLAYLFLTETEAIKYGNLASIESINVSLIPLLLATIVIARSEKTVASGKGYRLLLIATLIAVIIHVLIGIFMNGIVVVGTDPTWTALYGVYELVYSQVMILGSLGLSASLIKEISGEMKKKLTMYNVGLILIDIAFISVILDNLNWIPAMHDLFSYLNMLMIIGAFLVYAGIVRR